MATKHGKEGSLYLWNGSVSDLTDEACTESGVQAQITDADKRILSPNHTQTFTDSGGKTVERIDYLNGIAYFSGNVGTVTITGKYIPAANIVEVANLYNWRLDVSGDLHEVTAFGDDWKKRAGGLLDWKGSIDGFWLNSTWFDALRAYQVGGVSIPIWIIKLFIDEANTIYYRGFCHINGLSITTPVGDLVKEAITFTGFGAVEYKTS